MVLPAESKSASMRNGVSRLEYITNPEPLQIGNDFQTRIFKEFLHMFSRESRALARVRVQLPRHALEELINHHARGPANHSLTEAGDGAAGAHVARVLKYSTGSV